jgi:hypothetical protein
MAKISVKRKATIELSEEDWNKIEEIYDMLNSISGDLEGIGLELESPEVTYKGFGEGFAIGEHLNNVYCAIDELLCERSGLY